MSKTYMVNEIFYSIQGEGMRAGTANFFLRFTGCNMRCAMEEGPKSPGGFDCDTEFESGRKMTAGDIVDEFLNLNEDCKWVIATGGEPGLQLDDELIDYLHGCGYKVAIETNGSLSVSSDVDWITVSPKVAEHAIKQRTANEVKYVRGYGQGIPKTVVEAAYYLISPAFDGLTMDQRALDWCVKLVKENPKWRLSPQYHKLLQAR